MAFADADEAARQRFGEQRARNSGWDEMTFDCANPKDVRYRDFGILSRNMVAFNPKKVRLATPCVERDIGRNKHRTRPCLAMSLDSKKWQFKIPQSFIDSKHGEMLAPSLTKGVALQFGLRLDPRWVKDPAMLAYTLDGGEQRARDMVELSRLINTDHICRNPACINPGHLQLVPQIENTRRDSMRIDRKATRLCLAQGCTLSVSAQFPDGFNLCRPCGGDAPTVNWIGEQIAFAFA